MARLPVRAPSRAQRAMLIEAGLLIYNRSRRGWEELTPREREDLVKYLRKAKGRLGNLSDREKTELRRIIVKAGKGSAGLGA